MINQEFMVFELFKNQEDLIGQRVAINTVLVIRGEECYLTQNFDLNTDTQRINIHSPEIEEKLSSSIPCWVGGPATYFDTVKIVGVLRNGTARRNSLSISDVSLVVLYRDEGIYEIEL
ncbi:hypothetical protein [Serratia fonticola]|uniref:hypothetical protein n=1 Tax=Serratia fonticola TaxID=47917 RepID=UPI0021BDC3C8|nr:hypothetical protein [Serratia fonticola]